MKFLKPLFHFYIHSSLHIATATWAFLKITSLKLHLSIDQNLEIVVLCGTQLIYTFLKNFSDLKNNKKHFKNHKSLLIISLLSFVIALFSFSKLATCSQLQFLKIGILILCYPIFRKFGWLKIFIVAFCFAYITVYIPATSAHFATANFQNFSWQRFIIVLCLILPFDILDCKTDPKSLKTIPQLIGIPQTKILGLLFLSLYFYISSPINSILDFAILLSIALAIIFANHNCNRYYSLFWVESIPIFWLLALKII
jgi:hypothetical protein